MRVINRQIYINKAINAWTSIRFHVTCIARTEAFLILASRVWISSLCFSCLRTRTPTFFSWLRQVLNESRVLVERVFDRCRHHATAGAQRSDHREFCFGRMSGWCSNPFFVFSSHFAIYFREFYSGIDRDPPMRRALAMRSLAAKSR
jgi:hypothetical protein